MPKRMLRPKARIMMAADGKGGGSGKRPDEGRASKRLTHPEMFDRESPNIFNHLFGRRPEKKWVRPDPEKQRIRHNADRAPFRRFEKVEEDITVRIENNPLVAKHWRVFHTPKNRPFLGASIYDLVKSHRGTIGGQLRYLFYPNERAEKHVFDSKIRGDALINFHNAWLGRIVLPEEAELLRQRMSVPESLYPKLRADKVRLHKLVDSLLFDACMAELVGNPRKEIYPSRNPEIRITALNVLADMRKEGARPVFVRYIEAARPESHGLALEGIAKLGTEEDLDLLVNLSEGKGRLATQAFDAIRHVGRPRAVRMILDRALAAKGTEAEHLADMLSDASSETARKAGEPKYSNDSSIKYTGKEGKPKEMDKMKMAILQAANALGTFPTEFRPYQIRAEAEKMTVEELARQYRLI